MDYAMIVDFGACDKGLSEKENQLSLLDMTVISLASGNSETDLRSTNEPRGRLCKAILKVFGYRPVRPLANPRLEALRQLAAILHHHGDAHQVTTERFLAAGLTFGEIMAVRAAIGKPPGQVEASNIVPPQRDHRCDRPSCWLRYRRQGPYGGA
jgi:hypothetical protein